MSGNTFGKLFKITTFGESHNDVIGVVIDGMPANIKIDHDFINNELKRRKPANNPFTSQRSEDDNFKIHSGTLNNITTGCPILVTVENKAYNSENYEELKDIFRPSHADYTYFKKYGIRDYRGGGRSSGRETIARVIAGAFAKVVLNKYNIKITSYTLQVGKYKVVNRNDNFADSNFLRFADENLYDEVISYIKEIKDKGDSVGGLVELIARNVPTGLGLPVFDKLDADISKALMSIGAVKGVEIGNGFLSASLLGSENNDEMNSKGFITNNCGGILGGISTGEDIIVRIAVKPTPSISIPQRTINEKGDEVIINIKGMHDTIIVPRILPVAESMLAIAILDHLLMYNK